jgi:hypothetical protein
MPSTFGHLPAPEPLSLKTLTILLPWSVPRAVVVVERGQRFQLLSRGPRPPTVCSVGIVQSGSTGTSNGETEATFIASSVGWADVVTSVPIYGGPPDQPVPTEVLIEVRPSKE